MVRYTFKMLYGHSLTANGRLETDRLAGLLTGWEVKSGDIVAVFATNSPEMVFAIAAVTKLGAIPALINSALTGT
jgi:acyl-coenzyme A synthetase/AMP-(fatty) acid ligase